MLDHAKSNAVAYLALFIALGGVGWAAVKLPRNSVGAQQVKSGAIGTAEVRDRALLARDFGAGQLPAGQRGPQGPAGSQGPAGQQGPGGTQGAIGPTFADVGGDATQDPAPSPDGGEPTGVRRYAFTTPAAGRVLLEWRGRMAVNCTAPPGNIGIYLDGAPVPASGRDNTTLNEVSVVGLTGVLSAGAHVAHIRVDSSVTAPRTR